MNRERSNRSRPFRISLNSNGAYWQASWTNENGKRCRVSLGAKAKLPRHVAYKLIDELRIELIAELSGEQKQSLLGEPPPPDDDTPTRTKDLFLDEIRTDPLIHPRQQIDQWRVDTLVEQLDAGAHVPPVTVCHERDTGIYWLADGFTRYHATGGADRDRIKGRVVSGDRVRAMVIAINSGIGGSGVRLTPSEIEAAVHRLLDHALGEDGAELVRSTLAMEGGRR